MSLLYVSCIKNTEGGISANTIQQMGSRKLIPTKIIGGNLCVPNDVIPELEEQYSRLRARS